MWYKECQNIFDEDQSFKIENFKDRNLINSQIKALESIAGTLEYCSRLVHQTQRGARSVANQIRENKKISSFPPVVELLQQADKVAMDSPNKFAELCKQAAHELDLRIKRLIELRSDFSKGPANILKPKKGLF